MSKPRKRIGVIGAGPAGLCFLRHASTLDQFSLTAWEQQEDVGGLWIYSPNTGTDKSGNVVHSSIYQNLKTNLPKEVMNFPDFPFKDLEESFLTSDQVLNYLRDYVDHFELRQFIQFGHKVEEVEYIPCEGSGSTRWKVVARNLSNGITSVTTVDYLIICNGHYSVPMIPGVENIAEFKGKVLHSRDYREPDDFMGCKVAVLGAKYSGIDISFDVSKFADQVFLCHNLPFTFATNCPINMHQTKGIQKAKNNGFLLTDGSFIEVDALIYCTGYQRTLPFLKPSCGVSIEEDRVWPIYKHIVNAAHPSMLFVGLADQNAHFTVFHLQAKYCVKICQGTLLLPTEDEMQKECENAYQQNKNATCSHYFQNMNKSATLTGASETCRHNFHNLVGSKTWDYIDELIKDGQLDQLPGYYLKIFRSLLAYGLKNYSAFHSLKFKVTGPDSFDVILPQENE